MRSVVVLTLMVVALAILEVGDPPAAVSADQVVLSDSHIARMYVLGDTLVYERVGPGGPEPDRGWMRRVSGRTLRARRIPADARASAIGRDRHGRVVLTMVVTKVKNHALQSTTWWIYDVAS